jgi:hypothetical protein
MIDIGTFYAFDIYVFGYREYWLVKIALWIGYTAQRASHAVPLSSIFFGLNVNPIFLTLYWRNMPHTRIKGKDPNPEGLVHQRRACSLLEPRAMN